MPIWIPEYLTKSKTESSDDQTLYVDLPEKEQISFLKVRIQIQNTSTVNLLRSILDPIEKFEVIADGVKTIYNLEPEIASYIQFVAQNGKVAAHELYDHGAWCRIELDIPFGRYRFDEEYMLDTGLYDSVQLRIPYKLNTTYETTGKFTHSILMYRPLEKLAPVGLIRSRTIQKEAPTAAVQTIEHKLPMTYPWYYLGVRVEDIDANINADLTAVKLNIDEGRLVLFDLKADELLYADADRFPDPNCYANRIVVTGSGTFHTFGNRALVNGAIIRTAEGYDIAWTSSVGEQSAVSIFETHATVATDAVVLSLDMPSPNPHKCLTLYDGRKEPFPAADYTQAKVEYELANKTMTLHTFIREVVLGKLS